jgi:hypothetical protein
VKAVTVLSAKGDTIDKDSAQSDAAPFPDGLRAVARRLRDGPRSAIRRIRLNQAFAELDAQLFHRVRPQSVLLDRLVRAWNNESWSAGTPFLLGMLEWLPRSSGSVLECGSGLSTLVLGAAIAHSARTLLSLEHDPAWVELIRARLPKHVRARVTVAVSPLRSYGSFDWYSLPEATLPDSIGFVVCDGPPGSTRGGRFGLAPVLKERLAPGCILLLDDTHRAEERAIVDRWIVELRATVVEAAPTYSVLRVGNA